MPSRRKSRELALQMLFQWDLGRQEHPQVIESFLKPRRLDSETERFARLLFEGAVEEAAVLDDLVRAHAEHWKFERIAAVDRNILRLALFELRHVPENPPAVVINEALELGRRFSGADSVEFINGVLEAAWKGSGAHQAGS